MGFEIVEKSVLTLCKKQIPQAFGGADHFYLSSSKTGRDALGWGTRGIEVTGVVKVTAEELDRIEKFIEASPYSASVNNCEHFANYVLHGISYSSQMHNSLKQMGAKAIEILQPVKSASANYSDAVAKQIAYKLNQQLRQVKVDRANAERVEFWRLRGVDCC
jgi:hypothetical protein